jgi:hypothetical protein
VLAYPLPGERFLVSLIKRASRKALRLVWPRIVELLDRGHATEARAAALEARLVELEAAAQERDRVQRAAPQFVPPGHFYSAVPMLDEVERAAPRLYDVPWRQPPGVDLREAAQLDLLNEFLPMYAETRFPAEKHPDWRYFWKNPAYSYSDSFFLHAMLRHAKPRRVVEVGSGYSSCMTLDTNDRWFDGTIECTFIEPYPKLLEDLLRPEDRERIRVIASPVQEAPLDVFSVLGAGDVLFIDSTHVARAGSDVNFLFFDVLPRLAAGVYVHVHDVFFPFEYPLPWLRDGRQWQELYLMRAFLMYNRAFEVVLMSSFLDRHHGERIRRDFPLCAENAGGSIWLRKGAS